MNPTRGGWLILLTLFVAMILSVVHLPQDWAAWLGWLRPNWMLLVLFFWVMELPHRLGLIAAWCLGVLMDGLLGEPLGLNGLLLAAFTYLTWRFFERLRMYSALQQCGVIFMLVLAAELVRQFVISLGSEHVVDAGALLVALMSMLLWPFVYLLLIRAKTAVRVE